MKINGSKRKNGISKARRSKNVFRFIDDLTAFSDAGEIKQSFKEINPLELVFKNKNVSRSEGSFLDLFVKIEKNQCRIQLCVETDDFSFCIVRIS